MSQPDAISPTRLNGELSRPALDDAFREWYEATLPRVYGYLYSRCGRNAELAEELTQQTFIEAVRSGVHKADSRSVNWVIGIARHRLVDHFRALERRERTFLRLVQMRPPQAIAIEQEDIDERVAAALDRLPAAQRAALILRYVDDLAVRDVARLTGRTEASVESLLSRGRATLRDTLTRSST